MRAAVNVKRSPLALAPPTEESMLLTLREAFSHRPTAPPAAATSAAAAVQFV